MRPPRVEAGGSRREARVECPVGRHEKPNAWARHTGDKQSSDRMSFRCAPRHRSSPRSMKDRCRWGSSLRSSASFASSAFNLGLTGSKRVRQRAPRRTDGLGSTHPRRYGGKTPLSGPARSLPRAHAPGSLGTFFNAEEAKDAKGRRGRPENSTALGDRSTGHREGRHFYHG